MADKNIALMKLSNGQWSDGGTGSGLNADLIRGLPGDFTKKLTSAGYQKLPGGLIFQWGDGKATTDDNGYGTYLFPITFPNACFTVSCVDDGSECVSFGVTKLNKNGFTAFTRNSNGEARTNSLTGCRFIAIGY